MTATGARHKWNRSGYDITSRSCKTCWATGSRQGKGSAPWTTRWSDGSYARSGLIPPCPGTPWVRRENGRMTYWAIGEHSHRTEVTPLLVSSFGRGHVEQLIERNGFPPLPEHAWKDLL